MSVLTRKVRSSLNAERCSPDAVPKIKVLNTINFKKSMHYNPFTISAVKDVLKLVNTIIANT